MRRLQRTLVLLLLGVACGPVGHGAQTPEGGVVAGSPTAQWLEARDVRVEPLGSGRRVTIALTREPDGVQERLLSGPSRLVIDLAGPRPTGGESITQLRLSDDLVTQARVGAHGASLRAVLDLSRDPGRHTVRREGANVIVELGDVTAAVPADGAVAAGAPVAAPTSVPLERAEVDEASSPAGRATAADGLAVRGVRVEPVGTGRRLTVELTRAPDDLHQFMLPSPPRLVIDLRGPHAKLGSPVGRFALADDLVSRVRTASNGDTLRVVIDFRKRPDAPAVRQEGTRLIAEIGTTGTVATAMPEASLAPAIAEEPVGEKVAADAPTPEPAAAVVPPHVDAPEPVAPPPAAAAAEPPPAAEAPPSHHARAKEPGPRELVGDHHFTGQRISLDFKDADLQNVLRVLADVSGLNIVATDDVKGKVTLHLVEVPWDQALDLVLHSNRLEATREDNVVRISTVARLKEEREALRAADEAEKELEPLRTRYLKVNYAHADDALVDKVKGVLTDRGSVTFDDRTNTVIVRDIHRGTVDAADLIRELDTQSPQVLIEANIVEATKDFARALGVQWGYQYNAGPQTGNPTGMNFPGTIGLGGSGLGAGTPPPAATPGVPRLPVPFLADFPVPAGFGSGFGAGTGSAIDLALGSIDGSQMLSTRLTALEEEGKAKVISRPRVITMNNVAATIQSLTILRVKLPSTGTVINTGTGGAAGSASTATEKINTGITLVVTPQISSDGFVLMSIYAKSSQPDFTRTVDGIPNEISREANSNVLIRNGETVVLGGIYRNTSDYRESGMPFLRNIPAIGWLFKRMLENTHHEELLVFLTPKIVNVGTAALPPAGRLWEERRQGG
jgi:type IV pilus assembly protein PilQ